ncbi:MAG: DJ-1/PfpI family protein [Planctomycetota bacterium]
MTGAKRTVGILLFEGVELLDFAGPYEVFGAAHAADEEREPLFDVFSAAEQAGPLTCRNGLIVQPDHDLTAAPRADVLVVPGGRGTRTAIDRPQLIEWIAAAAAEAELTAGVCTGSFLMAKAGLLDGRAATTHWRSIRRMQETFSAVEVRENTRWVEDGDRITSAGVSAGIDMAFQVVRRLYGAEAASATARSIEYDHWPPPAPSA